MGRSRAEKASARLRSHTLSSSPSSSSTSSSDFEFTVCSSPHNNSSATADDLFYKGKLLPLHLSPRLSMVRTLLLASSSTTTSSSSAASRDSSGSSSSSDAVLFADYHCDSSSSSSARPSSVADPDQADEFLKPVKKQQSSSSSGKYFSLAKISSVFKSRPEPKATSSAKKGMSASARDVFKKYMKKVKPLYEKLSSQKVQKMEGSISSTCLADGSIISTAPHSFSGSLWFPKRKGGVVASSCPSSMRSSPCHSGVLDRTGFPHPTRSCSIPTKSNDSSMEELQSAIQGAIAHCKNSMKLSGTGEQL